MKSCNQDDPRTLQTVKNKCNCTHCFKFSFMVGSQHLHVDVRWNFVGNHTRSYGSILVENVTSSLETNLTWHSIVSYLSRLYWMDSLGSLNNDQKNMLMYHVQVMYFKTFEKNFELNFTIGVVMKTKGCRYVTQCIFSVQREKVILIRLSVHGRCRDIPEASVISDVRISGTFRDNSENSRTII